MPAIRVTFNTDDLADDESCHWDQARKLVAERLPELSLLLAKGEYVGRFALGAPWKVVQAGDSDSDPIATGFATQAAAINWVNQTRGENWTSDDFRFVPTGTPLYGDVDEL